jgi:hypothetical protein
MRRLRAGKTWRSHARDLQFAGLDLPKNILYATSARLGGSGLDAVAAESVRIAHSAGILGRALAFENRQSVVSAERIRSLRWNPVRLLSGIGREFYYGAKKHALDRAAAKELATGNTIFSTAGRRMRADVARAKRLGIPSMIEIPTWHRNKGKTKPARLTKTERERAESRGWVGMKNRLLVTRSRCSRSTISPRRSSCFQRRRRRRFWPRAFRRRSCFGINAELM